MNEQNEIPGSIPQDSSATAVRRCLLQRLEVCEERLSALLGEERLAAVARRAAKEVIAESAEAGGGDLIALLVKAANIVIQRDTRRRERAQAARLRRRRAAEHVQEVFERKHAGEIEDIRQAMEAQQGGVCRCFEKPESLARSAVPPPNILNRLTPRERAMAEAFPEMLANMPYFDILCFWFFENSREHPGLPVTWAEIRERLGISNSKISAAFRMARLSQPLRFRRMKLERSRRLRESRGGSVCTD